MIGSSHFRHSSRFGIKEKEEKEEKEEKADAYFIKIYRTHLFIFFKRHCLSKNARITAYFIQSLLGNLVLVVSFCGCDLSFGTSYFLLFL